MRKLCALFVPLFILAQASVAAVAASEPAWTIVLHPKDYVIGDALKQLQTRYKWTSGLDDKGGFEIALRKNAVAIPAPQCRMDYLILKIPFYYPETPKQASVEERRKIYDAFVSLQTSGKGSITAHVEAPLVIPIGRLVNGRYELTACNLFFAFPLSVQTSP